MPALCGHCGGTVMPYGRYFMHSRPTAVCDACGCTVRLRHFWKVVGLGLTGFGAFLAGLLFLDSAVSWGALTAGLAAVFLGLDRWSWNALPWDPVGDSRPAGGGPADADGQAKG